jgi:NADH-quinone oxidoreductase subunit A
MMDLMLAQAAGQGDASIGLVIALLLFVVGGVAMVLGALMFGWFLRPKRPNPDKGATYECGEPTIGSSWIQFDLRFYVVALVFVIFDVEIALFYPWAVVYGGGANPDAPPSVLQNVRWGALADMLFFFGVVVVGFLYLWKYGYLDWVRTSSESGVRGSELSERGPGLGSRHLPSESSTE